MHHNSIQHCIILFWLFRWILWILHNHFFYQASSFYSASIYSFVFFDNFPRGGAVLAAGLTLELSTDVGDLVGFVLGGRILRSKLVRFLQNATWDCCSGIYNTVKHLWWSFLGKQLTVCLDYFHTFVQNTFFDVLLGPKHAFGYFTNMFSAWEKIWDWNSNLTL